MNRRKIIFIDQTLREGMQHRGIVFSRDEKVRILEFQQQLGVDICQAGYPPAHTSEKTAVAHLQRLAGQKKSGCIIAAMGRAHPRDIQDLLETGVRHFHLHSHIQPGWAPRRQDQTMADIRSCTSFLKKQNPDCRISLAMLDLGCAPPRFLQACSERLIHSSAIDTLSLPDTSGIMAPNTFHDAVKTLAQQAMGTGTTISVHCHNDLGMATANTVMGVVAGAGVVEVSALGIGERNGIGDLFTVARTLHGLGYEISINIDKEQLFTDYYAYVNRICIAQTGEGLITYNTPFFGEGVNTHVAGTHAGTPFGVGRKQACYLNVLCGRGLVQKYLTTQGISHPSTAGALAEITAAIKDESARRHRRLHPHEVQEICHRLSP